MEFVIIVRSCIGADVVHVHPFLSGLKDDFAAVALAFVFSRNSSDKNHEDDEHEAEVELHRGNGLDDVIDRFK